MLNPVNKDRLNKKSRYLAAKITYFRKYEKNGFFIRSLSSPFFFIVFIGKRKEFSASEKHLSLFNLKYILLKNFFWEEVIKCFHHVRNFC